MARPLANRAPFTVHAPRLAAFVNRHKERERRHNRGHGYLGRIPRVCIPTRHHPRGPSCVVPRFFPASRPACCSRWPAGRRRRPPTTTFRSPPTSSPNCAVAATDMDFGDLDWQSDITLPRRPSASTARMDHGYSIALDGGTGGRHDRRPHACERHRTRWRTTCTATPAHTTIWGDDRTDGHDTRHGVRAWHTAVNHTVYGQLLAAGNENAPVPAATPRRSRHRHVLR